MRRRCSPASRSRWAAPRSTPGPLCWAWTGSRCPGCSPPAAPPEACTAARTAATSEASRWRRRSAGSRPGRQPPTSGGAPEIARTFYVVRCDFPRRDLLDEWDRWYVGHIELLLTVPGFLGGQRFTAEGFPDG